MDSKTILSYWIKSEFFQPFFPKSSDKPFLTVDEVSPYLPWPMNNDLEKLNIFTAYFGKVKSQIFIEMMLKYVGTGDLQVEDDITNNSLYSLKVGPSGKYINESFKVSPFVWAVSEVLKAKSLSVTLDQSMCNVFNDDIDTMLISEYREINEFSLNKIHEVILKRLGYDNNFEYKWFIDVKEMDKDTTKKFHETGEVDIENTIEIMNSFYVDDLIDVRAKFNSRNKINSYIQNKSNEMNISINNDVKSMTSWTMPDRYPLGKWPSKYSPSLMQQLAINLGITNKQSIFSVNGPPGTGKTTLLKEIIASNVVERAINMIEFSKPDDAFSEVKFNISSNKHIVKYFIPHQSIAHQGIIVASNNNSAVENISLELPKNSAIDNCASTLFEEDDIYFKNTANVVSDRDDSWGLISAKLGNQTNIRNFVQGIWFDPKSGLIQLYKELKPSWNDAKKNFKFAYQKVKKEREKIKADIKDIKEFTHLSKEINSIIEEHNVTKIIFDQNVKKFDSEQQNYDDLNERKDMISEKISTLNSKIKWYHYLLAKFGKANADIIDLRGSENAKIELIDKILKSKDMLISKKKLKDESEQAFLKIDKKHKESSRKLEILTKVVESCKKKYKDNFAFGEFWNDIERNLMSQKTAPWTHTEYDIMREELFYEALKLTEAFILNSKSVKENIKNFINLSDVSIEDRIASKAHIINTLQILVPVISTTFASVGSFLKHVQENELGLLVVDEAGQATPQSAIGALWRSHKAIIVGDPLQVEPIDTLPKQLREVLVNEYGVDSRYGYKSNSVQLFSDKINKYGGKRHVQDQEYWLGCPLLIHRRCIEPMFSISNEIAYNGLMFNETAEPSADLKYAIEKSVWYSIQGSARGKKNHFVSNQSKLVCHMINSFIVKERRLPDLYIISPFTSVVFGLKKDVRDLIKKAIGMKYLDIKLKEVNGIVKNMIGTVHTFQGREANEVFLVLGCDKEYGCGAANWVGSSPNILNVAVSRAKYRLGVIGDVNVWSKVNHISTFLEHLPVVDVAVESSEHVS